jgi:hypothetical protein
VVPEYGHNGHLRATHGFDERARLARLAVQRQVAGEQDEIRLARSIREHGGEPLVSGPARVDDSGRCDLDHARTVPLMAILGNHQPWPSSTNCSRR